MVMNYCGISVTMQYFPCFVKEKEEIVTKSAIEDIR